MNLGIVGSTIIGGMLILSIITLNLRVSQHSGENTLYHTAKMQTDVLAEVMSFDLRQVGYKVDGPKITAADSAMFAFNTTNIIDGNPELIAWHFDSGFLSREVNGDEVTMSSGVTEFEFVYYDSTGAPTITLNNIRQIKVSLITESAVRFGNRDTNPSSAWEAVFTPRNLNL